MEKEILKRIRRLQEREERERTGLHFVEGIRPVLQATDAGIPFEAWVHSEILNRNPVAQKKVRLARVPVERVTPEEFRTISRTPRASGIGAIVRQHWTRLDRIDPYRGLCLIAISRLRSPGNLGTIARTAEAVGAGGLIFLGESADPFDPAAVRASMGGLFRLHLVRTSLEDRKSTRLNSSH